MSLLPLFRATTLGYEASPAWATDHEYATG
jgi:hypothetical protein